MDLNAIAAGSIFLKFRIVFEKMMSYGSLCSSSVFCSSHQGAQAKNRRREKKVKTAGALCSPEFNIKALFDNNLMDENTISFSTVRTITGLPTPRNEKNAPPIFSEKMPQMGFLLRKGF